MLVADNLYLGSTQIAVAYLGPVEVWTTGFAIDNLTQQLLDALPPIGSVIQDEKSGTGTMTAQPGGCCEFDGLDDHIVLDSTITLAGDFTVMVRAKHDVIANGDIMFGGGPSSTNYLLSVRATKIYTAIDGVLLIQSHSIPFVTGQWNHWTVRRSGGDVSWLHNGVQIGTTQAAAGEANIQVLGALVSGGNNFPGSLSDARVYSAALTDQNIADIDSDPLNNVFIDDCVEIWTLEGTHETIEHGVVNGLNGTKNGITPATFHYTGSDVPYSFLNEHGYSLDGSSIIPASLTTPTEDAAGNTLQFTGPAQYPGSTHGSHCLTLNGVGQEVDCGSVASMHALQNLTIAFWGKKSTINSYMGIGKVDSLTNRIGIAGYDNGLTFYCNIADGSNSYGYCSTVPHTTEWTSYVMVFDGSGALNADRLKLYIDGEQLPLTFSGGAIPAATPTVAANLKIGQPYTGWYAGGSMCGVTIHGTSWTLEQIETYHTLGGHAETEDVLADWPLGEGGGEIAHNRASNEHGNITGTTPEIAWAELQPVFSGNLVNGFSLGNKGRLIHTPVDGDVFVFDVKSTQSQFIFLTAYGEAAKYALIAIDGSTSTTVLKHASQVRIDGVVFTGSTRDEAHTDLFDGQQHEVEITMGPDFETWETVEWGNFFSGQYDLTTGYCRLTSVNGAPPVIDWGDVQTLTSKIPALLDGTADAIGGTITNPAGAWHNGAETLIDFTGGVASPASAAWNTSWAFADAVANPLFSRQTIVSSVVTKVDRFIAATETLSGDDLAAALAYTADVTS